MVFKDYLGVFVKLFLDDFSMFNDLNTNLTKLQLCFDKCRKFGIILNLEKCMFLEHSSVILSMWYPRKASYQIRRKFWLLFTCLPQKHLRTFMFSMTWHNTTSVSSRILLSLWLPLPSYYERQKFSSGQLSANRLGKKSTNTTWTH
jgi:hypothetical protein